MWWWTVCVCWRIPPCDKKTSVAGNCRFHRKKFVDHWACWLNKNSHLIQRNTCNILKPSKPARDQHIWAHGFFGASYAKTNRCLHWWVLMIMCVTWSGHLMSHEQTELNLARWVYWTWLLQHNCRLATGASWLKGNVTEVNPNLANQNKLKQSM